MHLALILFLPAISPAARSDLLASGYHEIRCYDETSGAFLRVLAYSGEEQEGITFDAKGESHPAGAAWTMDRTSSHLLHADPFKFPSRLMGLA